MITTYPNNKVCPAATMSSNDDYSHLSRALGKEDGFKNPTDPTKQKIIRALLAELIDLLSKDYELNN